MCLTFRKYIACQKNEILISKKNPLFNSLVVLAALTTALVIHSCKKDIAGKKALTTDATFSEARQWYENTYPLTVGTDKKNIQSAGRKNKNWSRILRPNWDKGDAFVSKGLNFIELPVVKEDNMAFTTEDIIPDQFNFNKANSISSLLLIKQKGSYGIYAMTILADASYLKGDRNKLKNNSYRKRDKDFTGMIFYHDMEGTFINGWRYVNGKVTNAIYHQKAAASPGNQSIQSTGGIKTNVLQDCMATVVVTVYSICDYPANDVNLEHPSNCTYSSTVDIYYDDDCGNADVPGTGGGAAPPPNPCPPSGGGQYADAITNLAKVQVYEPNPAQPVDPTGPINPPPPPAPCVVPAPPKTDTLKVSYCDNLTAAQRAIINTTVNEFKNTNCADQFLSKKFFQGQSLFLLCIKSGTGSAYYDTQSKSITFTTDYAATRVDLLEHELFHAFQDAYYPNGTATYGKNAVTGVASPGFANIEFEQAVFNDILNNGTTAFDHGTDNQRTAYTRWLSNITNNFTYYPRLTPGSTAYNNFITQYNDFLNQFNNTPNNPYSSSIINLNPGALINLFNQTNCN